MSFSTVLSASVFGMKVEFIRVEADVSNGLPAFQMVGYLSSEVKEASERVRTAIRNSGLDFPPKKTVINLAPATMRKKGASYDLPIALAILASLGQIAPDRLENLLAVGELSLDGRIRKTSGILPIVAEAKEQGIGLCIVPKENAQEGALVEGIRVIGAETLSEIVGHLKGKTCIRETVAGRNRKTGIRQENQPDYNEVCGQQAVKRAIEVAVAGGHNLLLLGPPGSGKSMAARRIPTIFPPLLPEESMELTRIYSVLGILDEENPLMGSRPFRSVHHSVSRAALTGGGMIPSPGEISLAHHGVLFLDELPEFKRTVIESLRQPLEEHRIAIPRSRGNYVFPANFMLVGAMNPCPCGCFPDVSRCTCTPSQIRRYLSRLSQPFLDRIDICVETPKVEYRELVKGEKPESSADIRSRVCAARKIQQRRYRGTGIGSNAMLEGELLETYCSLGRQEEKLMEHAYLRLGLTARTYYKVLKTARTIADLEGEEQIGEAHLSEAIGYRMMDRKYWGGGGS